MRSVRSAAPTLFLLVLGAEALGCRSHAGFREQYLKSLKPAIVRGDWSAAAASIDKSKGEVYREEDRVMFWLNHGTALHYAGQLEESSSAFFKAEETMKELFTKSISEEVGKVVVNETVQTYSGEDYERVLTYVYTSLNFAQLGRMSDALVEVRRADEFLKRMRVQFEKEDGLGTLYTEDAFMLWLIGVFLEVEGSYADAYLAYEASFRAYEEVYALEFGVSAPDFLLEDLIRTGVLAGREDAVTNWEELLGRSDSTLERLRAGDAEVILVHGNGEAPFKREYNFTAPLPDGYIVRVAIPRLVSSPFRTRGSVLRIGDYQASSVIVEPVARIGTTNFEKRLGGLKARAVARAAVKYAATKVASKAVRGDAKDRGRNLAGALVGLLGNAAAAISEGADLRSWTLLPGEFRVARIWVAPGRYQVEVDLLGPTGEVDSNALSTEVEVKGGERRFLSVRSVR